MTSKLTRERLQEIAEDGFLKHGESKELARMALAAMESEPVFFIEVEGDDWINAGRIPGGTFDFNNLPDGINNLYAAPQPATVVPPMQHWEELCRQYPDMSIRDAIIRAAWWNHCRAAMLQAGNSPVIPDGYVMVPKEPTQAMCAAFNDSDYGRKSLRERYVAMLAAAPQEVK